MSQLPSDNVSYSPNVLVFNIMQTLERCSSNQVLHVYPFSLLLYYAFVHVFLSSLYVFTFSSFCPFPVLPLSVSSSCAPPPFFTSISSLFCLSLCPVKRSSLSSMGNGPSACGVSIIRSTRLTRSQRRKEITRSTKMYLKENLKIVNMLIYGRWMFYT